MHCGHYTVAAGKLLMHTQVWFCCPTVLYFLRAWTINKTKWECAKCNCKSMHDTIRKWRRRCVAASQRKSKNKRRCGKKKKEARKTFAVWIVIIVIMCNIILFWSGLLIEERCIFSLFVFGKRKQRYSMLYVFTGVTVHNSWRFSYFFSLSMQNVKNECVLFEMHRS